MRIRLRNDQVLVQEIADPVYSLSPGDDDTGIYMPEAYRRFSRRGRVIAVGPGHRTRKGAFVPTELEPGNEVELPVKGRDATLFRLAGNDHRILRESEILAVWE